MPPAADARELFQVRPEVCCFLHDEPFLRRIVSDNVCLTNAPEAHPEAPEVKRIALRALFADSDCQRSVMLYHEHTDSAMRQQGALLARHATVSSRFARLSARWFVGLQSDLQGKRMPVLVFPDWVLGVELLHAGASTLLFGNRLPGCPAAFLAGGL